MRGAAEDCLPRTLEVQDERETTVGEEQRGTVPRGGVVPCALYLVPDLITDRLEGRWE